MNEIIIIKKEWYRKMENLQNHWDKVYSKSQNINLGWYEETPTETIRLFETIKLNKADIILEVGVGTSNFLDYLIKENFINIWALDISKTAVNKKKELLGVNVQKINWIVKDITNSDALDDIEKISFWNDRALLHFLLEPEDRKIYVNHLNSKLKPGGYALIGVFSLIGANKCSGLEVHRYGTKELEDLLGSNYSLLNSSKYTYVQPSGNNRPFIYALFQKK